MANPQAEVNLKKFKDFVKSREEHADWEDYILPNRLDLNKKAIARDCDFDRKRITGNKSIFEIYTACVKDLINKGLLVEDTRTASEKISQAISSNGTTRVLKKAQESHAATSEELHRTKKELEKAQKKLERLEKIEEYMLSTGRL